MPLWHTVCSGCGRFERTRAEGHILIVDGDQSVRASLAAHLAVAGYSYKPSCASSGEAAIQSLESDPDVPLAIVSANMPGMGGLEFIERMSVLRPGIKALMTAGAPMFEMLTRAAMQGAGGDGDARGPGRAGRNRRRGIYSEMLLR